MEKKYKKKIAILMVLLVIMIPVYSSIVLADLSKIDASGKDNVNSYIRENDFINFKATASVSGDSAITAEQVLLGSNLQFDSCQAGISGFDCALRFPANGTTVFDARAVPYTVTLKNDAGNVIETKTSSLYVDNLAPAISSFSIDRALVNSGKVKFSFNISDKACASSSCAGKCSGIKRLELLDTKSSFKETIVLNADACSISDVFETSSLQFSEGSHIILAKAFDRFELVSSAVSAEFNIDKNVPFIDSNTFKIVDELDSDLGFFGTVPVPVTAKVSITDPDLDKSNVFADLSELNKNANLQNVQAACGQPENDAAICSWQLNLAPDGAGLKKVVIWASDNSGNKARTEITKNLILDNNGPIVLSLASDQVVEGQSFAKLENNSFIATFRDDSGVKPSGIKLHAADSIYAADSCSKSIDIWQCKWDNIDFLSSGKINVFIDTDSKDRLGNSVTQKFSKEVIVDSTKSKLLKVIVRSIGGTNELLANVTKTGDKIQVEAALEDDSVQKAVADFSKFILNAKNVEADACIKTGTKTFVCSWTTSGIDIEGFISDFIKLKFTDISGNVLEASYPFKVFGITGDETPDFWENSVRCSPSLLDRETLPLISQRAFCLVSLKPKSFVNGTVSYEDIEPVASSLGECSGDASFLESVTLENNRFTKEPLLRISFKKQDIRLNEINLLCPVDIISRKGNNIVAIPEKENVGINFKLYNQPLGEVSESVQKKIDDAVNDADNILRIATWLDKIIFYATRICQIGNIIANVVALYKLIGAWLSNAELALGPSGAGAAITSQRIATDVTTENLRQMVTKQNFPWFYKFCSMVNCKHTFEKGDAEGILGGVGEVMISWQKAGSEIIGQLDVGNFVGKYVGKGGKVAEPGAYLNPRDSIVVAAMTACIPGIIHGLNKYRQIQCMYADCMQTGVGKQGLPVFACEDQKGYATCKYIVGEIFQVIPFTAMFNYYVNLLKATLANPFKILGAGVSLYCNPAIFGAPKSYDFCAGAKVVSFLGHMIQEVTSIFEEGAFKIRDDFCSRLEKSSSNEKSSTGVLG